MLLVLAGSTWWGAAQHGATGVLAAVIAVGICWLCSTAALAIFALFLGTRESMNAMLGGVLIETVLPIGIGLLLKTQVPALAEAGVFGLMMPAFLIALAAKTLLVLWLLAPYRSAAKAP
jgi:hypothetical protein